MKKFIMLCIAIALTLSLCSCDINKETSSYPTESFTPTETTFTENSLITEGNVNCEELYFYSVIKDEISNMNGEIEGKPVVSSDTSALFYHKNEEDGLMIMHKTNQGVVPLESCLGLPFINIVSQMQTNPFSAFYRLVNHGLVESKTLDNAMKTERGLVLDLYNMSPYFKPECPEQTKFSYSQKGCEDLVSQLMSSVNSGSHKSDILNESTYTSSSEQIFYSEIDNCYYTFIITYNTSYAYMTALYFRSDNNEYINDITLESMFINYPVTNCSAGIGESLHIKNSTYNYDMLTLITCIEELCTGNSYVSDNPEIVTSTINENFKKYIVPYNYMSGDYHATLNRSNYITNNPYSDYFIVYTYTLTED